MRKKWFFSPLLVILLCAAALLCRSPKPVQAAVNPCDKQNNEEVPYNNAPWLKYKGSANNSLLASYSGNFKISIDKKEVDASAAKGERVVVSIRGSGSEGNAANLGFHIYYDTRLTLIEPTSFAVTISTPMRDFSVAPTLITPGQLYVTAAAAKNHAMTGELMGLIFELPMDALPGDLYPIGIQYTADPNYKDQYINLEKNKNGSAMEAHVFTEGISNGYIKIEGPTSGTTGACRWDFDINTGKLTISGKGAMEDYSRSDAAPWYGWYKKIKSVEIGEGVTYIGKYNFCGIRMKEITIPDSVKRIGSYAFLWCYYLEKVHLGKSLQTIESGAFASNYTGWNKMTEVDIPETVKYVAACAFGYRYNATDGFTRMDSFTIRGACGSAAHRYAQKNSFTFISQKHKWDTDYTIDKQPTCTKEGSKSIHCSECHAIKDGSTQTIPKAGHMYGEWKVIKEASATKEGLKERTCVLCGKIQTKVIPKKDAAPKKASGVLLGKTVFSYNGKVQKPEVVVMDGEMVVGEEFYKIKWPKGCKKVGTYTVTVAMKGDYAGTVSASYKIIPRATAITKITSPAKKQLTLTWKKRTTQVDGFQIQYATSKTFAKAQKVTIKSNTRTSAAIKKLTSKKTYYVRVRSYKKVAGKAYFSKWCKAKKLQVK